MKKIFLAAAISACLSSMATADETTLASDTNQPQPIILNDIVVSGEKQDRTLKNTTSSVTVIENEALKSTQYQNLRDVISVVPNVVVQTGVVPNVRGITGNGGAGGFNSISGGANARFITLVDGVAQPFVADFTGDSGLWDIEQIEVYRGPQSTNNGRNSIAGAMYIQTADPTFDWEGKLRLGYRNKDQYIDKAVVLSGPIIDNTLAFRFSGQVIDGQTITSNEAYDTNPTDIDLNELDTEQGRLKFLWLPTDDLELMFTHAKYNEEGDAGRRYFEDTSTDGYYKTFFRDMDTETDTTSIDMHYQLNDSTSFDVLLAVMDYEFGFKSYQANPAQTQFLLFEDRNKTFDVKINFGEGSHALNGFVGFDYFEREQDIASTGAYVYGGEDESDSKALYGEINFGLTDRLVLTGGLRYQNESQERDFVYTGTPYRLTEDNTILLPKLALQYDLTDNTLIGVSARKGYNSAGGALDTTDDYYYYDEEEVNTYELFSRSEFDDGRYLLRANLFFNDFDGYQGQNSLRRIVNVDKVETYGAEIEGTAWVTDDLELQLGLGLLHTEVKEGGINYTGVDGNELNSAPETTANLAATYYVNDNFNLGGNIQYTGGYYGDVENTEEREVGGFSLINLRASYRVGDLELAAFVNNITDKRARRLREPANPPRTPLPYADFVEPRHVGISATYTFL
ncbi:TonB-dependent receptor [Methylophaga sp. OBS1]|uniref:TonB-dependent receptor n=1 Tax=Methylophaga sp. OBS1 TaxID=2991933 RepID=UPI002255AB05|nr:TonB-dependent receptor [Methylophaga sp. OBS1]MCX4192557.1 TonB-dependent receptor [Methylophaga sp. OBS1]